jgi:hypothetical protein
VLVRKTLTGAADGAVSLKNSSVGEEVVIVDEGVIVGFSVLGVIVEGGAEVGSAMGVPVDAVVIGDSVV